MGVHPTRCGAFEASGDAEAHLASLAAIASANSRERGGRVVAIGECGLDYDRLQFCDAETQARSIHWSPYEPVRVVNADP